MKADIRDRGRGAVATIIDGFSEAAPVLPSSGTIPQSGRATQKKPSSIVGQGRQRYRAADPQRQTSQQHITSTANFCFL